MHTSDAAQGISQGIEKVQLVLNQTLKADLIALNLLCSLLVVFAAALMLRDMRMVLLAAILSLFGGSARFRPAHGDARGGGKPDRTACLMTF